MARIRAIGADEAAGELADIYAELVTCEPGSPGVEGAVEALRPVGLEDRAVLDATLVVSYFNFVNRMVRAHGTSGIRVAP
ncbi:MAG: hypothetical protein ACOC0E_10985 [Spirochaetota bacterium]